MSKRERIFYLDFIRAISIIFIVIFHFNCSLYGHSITGYEILFKTYANGDLGQIGVSLFFIISGASLMYTYQNAFSIKQYFKKRFIALYPMFWTAYAIAFLYLFYINCSINNLIPKWRFILTILGMDGYTLYAIPNFYILGEWFLGCIIILYFCFPILRKFTIEHPKLLISIISIIYIVVVEKYTFNMEIDRNVLTRVPEFLFGMYFIQYFKKINMYQFIGALCISTFMFIKVVNIPQMYIITIIGISLFIVLAFIGQNVESGQLKRMVVSISKYSYAIFLVHHIIIEQMLARFNGKEITFIESYCLFIITCIVIAIISIGIYKLYKGIIGHLKVEVRG